MTCAPDAAATGGALRRPPHRELSSTNRPAWPGHKNVPTRYARPRHALLRLRLHRFRQRLDFLVGRETAELLLGELQLVADRDLEHAAARLLVGDVDTGNLCELRSHTESPRLVVSHHAVFDDDLHGHQSFPVAEPGRVAINHPPPVYRNIVPARWNFTGQPR